jgi:hypothetical protein
MRACVIVRMRISVLVRMREANRRSRPCFRRFHFSITRRRIGNQRPKQMLGGMSDVVDGTIECFFIRLGRFGETAQLANKLKR